MLAKEIHLATVPSKERRCYLGYCVHFLQGQVRAPVILYTMPVACSIDRSMRGAEAA